MQMQSLHLRLITFVVSITSLVFSGWAYADPPSRVGRLGYMTGAVSFSPAGENDWVRATINRPLTTGDRLWTDVGARTEIQVGGAMIRMNAGTSVSVLNLDNRIVQLQLTQGTLNVRVRRLGSNHVFEVDTPNLAFTLRQPGEYRITVDPDGNATTIIVRKGQGEAYGEGAAYVLDSRQPYRFTGTGLREYQYVNAPRLDEFDRWSSERDRRYDNSGSARYVSQDVIGYQDLDAYGIWRVDAAYGNVWVPNRVAAGWAPYRDGHWAWVDPWGWTWVDDAPWGFAVSHYGRWTNLRGTWGWVPGPVRTQAYYAPALVAFVGGSNFQLTISSGNVGGVAWFPLGPREVYQPSYPASRSYFENINRSNTVINSTVINNYYNNSNVTNIVYANRDVSGAIIAVPTTAFVQSQPVSRAAVRVTREMVASAPVAVIPPIAPTERSVRGAAGPSDRPPPRVFERPIVARTAPPAAHLGFAAQQQQLTAKPGKPLDDAERKELKPAATVSAPAVKVVAPTQAAPPTLRPPPAASDARPDARPDDARGKSEPRGNSDQRGQPSVPSPSAPPQRAAPTPVAPPVPAVPSPEPRGKSEQRGNSDQRGQLSVPSPSAPPQRAAPPQVAPQQAAPPVPAVQSPEQRGRSEQRGNREQREQPVAPPPAPPQRAAPPQVAPQQAAPPVPAVQPPEQRGRSEQRGNRDQREQPVAPPQRTAEPRAVPPPVAPPAPAAQQPAKPERAPAARQVEPRPPVATPQPSPPQAQPVPNKDARGQKPKPDASKRNDKENESDEQKLEEEKRKKNR